MNWVMLMALIGLAAGYLGVELFAPAPRRRREVKALQAMLLADLSSGRRSRTDPGVSRLLARLARPTPGRRA